MPQRIPFGLGVVSFRTHRATRSLRIAKNPNTIKIYQYSLSVKKLTINKEQTERKLTYSSDLLKNIG